MQVSELPELLFILGRKGENNKFSIVIHNDKENHSFLSVWSSEDMINAWLANNKNYTNFSRCSRNQLSLILIQHSPCEYIILNPALGNGDFSSNSFCISSVPDAQIVKASRAIDLLPFIENFMKDSGAKDKHLIWIRTKCRECPDLKPLEFIRLANKTIALKDKSLKLSASELKAQGIFEDAWNENRVILSDLHTTECRIQLIRDIWEIQDGMNFAQVIEYASGLPETPTSILISRNEFCAVWKSLESELRYKGIADDAIQNCRLLVESQINKPPKEVIDEISSRVQERLSTKTLKSQDTFEEVWLTYVRRNRKTYESMPEHRVAFLKSIVEVREDMHIEQAIEHGSRLLTTPVKLLKERGEFGTVWHYFESELIADKTDPLKIQFAKSLMELSDHNSPLKAFELAARNYHSPDSQFAILNSPPPDRCSKCGENLWNFESLSPNRKSTIWICGHCKKTETVFVGMPNDTRGRQPIPKDVQIEVWQRDLGKCVECGSKELIEYDHIIPIAKGGGNSARNLQLLCQKCNQKKSAKSPGTY